MSAPAKVAFLVLSFILVSVMRSRGTHTYAAVPILLLAKMAGMPRSYLWLIKALTQPARVSNPRVSL